MIEIRDLYKSFAKKPVLKGITLSIPENKITTILGGSGSGKSVLIKHIMGLMKPDKGAVLVNNEDITNLSSKDMVRIRKKFGMLFQYSALFDSMSVRDNIAFPLKEHTKLKDKEIDKIIAQKLSLVGLEGIEELFPSDLSGGMQKRVALARAVVLEPSIIIYDEPTSGLDPLMAETVDKLIVSTQKKLNLTSIIISHDIPAAFRISDYIAVIYQGELVASGTPQEVKKSSHEYVKRFLEVGFR